MSDKDWFDKGYNMGDVEAEYESRGGSGLDRFYLKVGQERDIVFETDDPFRIWEHQKPVVVNGKTDWRNWFTCRKSSGDCPACAEGDSNYHVGFYVVRDMTGWEKNGKQMGVGKRVILPAKLGTLKKIQKFKERRGSLIGWKFAVSRTDSSAANCGDVFDPIGETDLKDLPEIEGEMPDFFALFKPLEPKDFVTKWNGGQVAPQSSVKGDTPAEESDDITFD